MSTSFPLPSSPHWDPRTAQTEPREFHSAWCFLGEALASAVALATTRRATRARLEADSLFCHDTRRGATTAADESATALICPEFRCVRCLLAYRHASKRCVVERRALRSGVDAREREGLAASGQPRLRRGAESDSIFCWHGRSQPACSDCTSMRIREKSPTGESPSRHPSTRTDENEPAGLFSAFRPERGWAGGAAATPNPAQKPRRGRRVSVPRPSRSLSRCEHTRINPHPPSPAIRPRGGAEAAHPFAHSRGKRRGAFAPPCGLPTPLALASAARPRRRRNASRHVASSTSARDDHHPPFAASIPRLTILPPLAFSPRRDTRPR